jgi:hypothetical protein
VCASRTKVIERKMYQYLLKTDFIVSTFAFSAAVKCPRHLCLQSGLPVQFLVYLDNCRPNIGP